MRSTTFAMSLAALMAAAFLLAAAPVHADTTTPTVDPEASTGDKALDELLAKEKESRKACKIDICSILRGKKAEGADVGCHIVQTWPKPSLDQLLSKAHVSWPWSHIHCQIDINLKRATLVAAMTQPKYEGTFDQHTISCDIEKGGGGDDKYSFKVNVTPKVTFENGKATTAQMQWGDIEAPVLAKGVIWPITALDNKTGVLSGEIVNIINQFIDKKCDEVKDQLKTN
jgi:hypothetical protein